MTVYTVHTAILQFVYDGISNTFEKISTAWFIIYKEMLNIRKIFSLQIQFVKLHPFN